MGLADLLLVGRGVSSGDLDLEFTIGLALKALSSLLSPVLNLISIKEDIIYSLSGRQFQEVPIGEWESDIGKKSQTVKDAC